MPGFTKKFTRSVVGDRSIVVVSSDVVGDKMAGPAIRAVELTRVLGRAFGRGRVFLAAPNDGQVPGIDIRSFGSGGLGRLLKGAGAVIGQGLGIPLLPFISSGQILILDFYDPNPVELLAFHRDSPRREARLSQEHLRHRLSALARRGDHFICATSRQRDFWLGLLAAEGRLTWEADRSHPNLDDLISIVPFGLPDEKPTADERVLKGVWPGIGDEDKVLLWGGGIWNWFDPLTVIRAIARIARKRSDIKLFFMGVAHPNPKIPAMRMTGEAMDLARELGLLDKHVFFNTGWVDYRSRAGFLLESDLAVLASGRDLETRLSFRTRLLDSLWAGLPMVLSEGDYFAELVRTRKLGRVVEPGDDRAMAGAILELLDSPEAMAECRRNIAQVAAGMTWTKVARPLVDFCAEGFFHPGADHSRLGPYLTTASYYARVLGLLLRYGGLGKHLRRRYKVWRG